MKKTLLFFIFLLSCSVYSQEKLLASCCESKEGRCSGSAYCSACSNCSRCKHCSDGGTCGVCASYTPSPKKESSSKKKYYSNSSKSSKKLPSGFNNSSFLIVKSETLNVRTGPGTNYGIIEKIVKGDFLIYLSFEGDWVKVKVIDSGKEGYVYYKYIEQ